jgi:CRP-like cAMP-binding protein
MPEWWPHVRSGGLVSRLNDDELARLLAACESASVEKGSPILQQGSASRSVLLIEEGEVEILDPAQPDGAPLAVVGPGGVVGEVGFVDGHARTHDVRARTACRLRRLKREALLWLLEQDPVLFGKLVVAIAELLAQRFRSAVAELEPIRAFASALDEPMEPEADACSDTAEYDEIEEPLPETAMADLISRIAERTRKGLAGV